MLASKVQLTSVTRSPAPPVQTPPPVCHAAFLKKDELTTTVDAPDLIAPPKAPSFFQKLQLTTTSRLPPAIAPPPPVFALVELPSKRQFSTRTKSVAPALIAPPLPNAALFKKLQLRTSSVPPRIQMAPPSVALVPPRSV